MFEKEAEKWTIDYVCKDCSRYKECKSKEHCTCKDCSKEKWQNGAEFGYNKCREELKKIGLALQSDMDKTIEQNISLKKELEKSNEWHKLDWEKHFPEADKLIRVRLRDGMEHICETCYYEPTEDEIGYGKYVISFYELNGEWVDDNDVIAWCEIEPFKESE